MAPRVRGSWMEGADVRVMAAVYAVLGIILAIVFIPMGCPVWVPIITLGPFVALFVALSYMFDDRLD